MARVCNVCVQGFRLWVCASMRACIIRADRTFQCPTQCRVFRVVCVCLYERCAHKKSENEVRVHINGELQNIAARSFRATPVPQESFLPTNPCASDIFLSSRTRMQKDDDEKIHIKVIENLGNYSV